MKHQHRGESAGMVFITCFMDSFCIRHISVSDIGAKIGIAQSGLGYSAIDQIA
jgi:hypothetical protein